MEPQKKPISGRSREAQVPRCPNCRTKTLTGELKCRACEYPYQGSLEERKAYIILYRDLVGRWKKADARVKQAASLLLIIGFFSLFGVFGTAFLFMGGGLGSVMEGMVTVILSIFGTATFIITGFLARKFGLVPLVIGTSFYGIFLLLDFIMNPLNLFALFRVIFLISLIVGTIAAANSTKIKSEIEQKLGANFLKKLLDKNDD